MARPEVAPGGETVIPICTTPAAGALPQKRRARAAAERETRLNWFVCIVAFGEWAGNAFGTLAFLWATVVLLGGFCTALNPENFWFATIMIFIEAFRMFSSNYKLDHQSLFGTTRAVKLIRSLSQIFVRPQEWNEVVAIIGLFFSLIMQFPSGGIPTLLLGVVIIFASKMQFPGALQLTSRLRQHRWLLLWALLVSLLLVTGLQMHSAIERIYRDSNGIRHKATRVYIMTWPIDRTGNIRMDLLLWCLFQLALVLAVLLLNLRPPRIANLTSSPCGCKLLSSAKLILALCLGGDILFLHSPLRGLGISLIILVLSLGSLQTPVDSTPFGRWANIFLYICFLGELVSTSSPSMMIVIIMLAVLLIGNLQIPAAVARIALSSLRLSDLALNIYPQGKDSNRNLMPSIMVFYVLALCQGTLYLMACIFELFAFFPRRSLVRHSRFRGQWGARAINAYYQRAYVTCMETGVFAAGRTLSLASFSIESLTSTSREMQLAGVSVLDALLQQKNFSEELVLRITGSNKAVRTLVGMLGWTAPQDRDIRLFAARVISKLADSLRLASIPNMLKLVSSLLDAENQPAWASHHHQQDSLSHAVSISINGENVADNQSPLPGQQSSEQSAYGNGENSCNQTTQAEGDDGCCSWACRCWHRIKEKHWSIPKDPPLTSQDSLPVLGMLILERLAYDIDNCTEISRATELIFKVTELISYTDDTAGGDDPQQKAVICSSLNLIRRLSIAEGKIGTTLRQEMWESPFLLNNLAGILEDSRSDPQIWKPAVEIIAMFALDEDARQEIGRTKVIINKLLHLFLGRDGTTNVYYDQQLRTAAGEALAKLAIRSTANCSAILKEARYELVKDLKNMIPEDEYGYVATALLQNLCAHSRDELRHPGEREHLSSALAVVMEKIMTAEGKELEALISLAAQIGDIIPECFVHELESRTNGAGLIRKLVYTLNSNKKPCPKYPRMRRAIIQITISLVESCPRCATVFAAEGMTEALSKIASTPSKVEKYSAFLGNTGVVLENGLPLPVVAARAKRLIDSATPSDQQR
ncbi:unnamed protein product [Urochloa decumbens]|uniref:BLE2 protein n=1 Tax=Urochloa decumbens TaxID=240449 RepID=A0ABC9G3U6_9POAL